jgi:hypothetical protein
MNSNTIACYGFNQWSLFSLESKNGLLGCLTKQTGVYVIRYEKNFGRLKGCSDILYIGSTINRKGMWKRIGQYFDPDPTQVTNKRIHEFLKRHIPMEISFIYLEVPERLESQLLQEYITDHDELPPLNRNLPKIS